LGIIAISFLVLAAVGLLVGAFRLRAMRLEEDRLARAADIQRELDARAAERKREDAKAAILRSTKRIAAEVAAKQRPLDDWQPRSRRASGWDD
jgi:hypothetical protein